MSMQAMARWLGEPKKVALLALLAATLAAVATLGLAAAPASAATFSNNSGITINSGSEECFGTVTTQPATADPYPSAITVSGLGSSISDVNVTISGLSHQFPEDVGLLLVSPAGQSTILMTDSGGEGEVSGIDLIFDDAASGGVPDEGPLTSGTYQPSVGTTPAESQNCAAPASFPAPAPASPYGSSLSVFNDTNPNGDWKLYVIDDTSVGAGSITGWSLDISATTAGDTTPPTVTDTSPDGTASKTANVTATFSEPVQNVTSSTFILERKIASKVKTDPPKYVLVDATVSLSDDPADVDDLIYVLNPAQDLPKGEYQATITTDVTDLADPANALEEPVVWTFTVAK
jgi:subtilisin-like proprotein convertase family protein